MPSERKPRGSVSGDLPASGAPAAPPDPSDSSDESEGSPEGDFPDDVIPPEEFPFDAETDPPDDPGTLDLRSWEREAQGVQAKEPQIDPPLSQRQNVKDVLDRLDDQPGEPGAEHETALLAELDNLQSAIPDAADFVAGNFSTHLPAWEEMLKTNRTRSARRVLSWLRHGFKPTFARPELARPEKRKVVLSMLQKEYPNRTPGEFLTGTQPHKVAFRNHQSFYKHC
ncbi:hypothetical protein KFL_002510190, partial [Klebsormidium nitens]